MARGKGLSGTHLLDEVAFHLCLVLVVDVESGAVGQIFVPVAIPLVLVALFLAKDRDKARSQGARLDISSKA